MAQFSQSSWTEEFKSYFGLTLWGYKAYLTLPLKFFEDLLNWKSKSLLFHYPGVPTEKNCAEF